MVRVEAAAAARSGCARSFAPGSGPWAESVCPSGEGENYVWTRKRPVEVECDIRIGERRIRTSARGRGRELRIPPAPHGLELVGGGRRRRRRPRGRLEPRQRHQRPAAAAPNAPLWIGDEVSEPGPVSFDGLDAIDHDAGRLEFAGECVREKDEKRGFVEYSYRQPFGTFSGVVPGGVELERGLGVMEHHDAHW